MFRDDWSSTERYSERRQREVNLRKQSLRQSWPTLILLPVLIGTLHACAWSLFITLILHESFGLSDGHHAPWPGAIAVIFVISFWINRAISRLPLGNWSSQAVTVACWFVTWLAWLAFEPSYRESRPWADPGDLVESNAYLIVPLLISMIVWWVGMTYASDIASVSSEDVRTVVQRDWLILVSSILLAALVDSGSGHDALRQARFVVPLMLIVSIALVAGAEVESTRRVAHRRGAQAPGWGRWARLVGGFSLAIILLSLLVLAVLSPDALDAVVGGIAWVVRVIGVVIGYILLAIVWAIFQVVILLTKLFNAIFGDMFGPIQQPEMQMQPVSPLEQLPEQQGETPVWEYAILLRWLLLSVVVAVVAFLLFRFTRRSGGDDEDDGVEEQRDSVFSADLARKQLRDLFRRRQREARLPKLDLDKPPTTVREAMVYLEVLAARQGAERHPEETPADFVGRLRAVWSGVASPLVDFPRRYERVRYGEIADETGSPDHEAAIRDWNAVWQVRRNIEPPKDPTSTPT